MFRRRTRLLLATIAAVGLLGTAIAVVPAQAADPASQDVVVPSQPGQTETFTWKGTISPGANPASDCTSGASPTDTEDINISVPTDLYKSLSATFSFAITWTPPGPEDVNDEVLTVVAPDGTEVGNSDTSNTTEQVLAQNLPAGKYQALACGFANTTPQAYTGTLTVTVPVPAPPLASADAKGLAFSAAVPADPQRDESEPLINVDGHGNLYTCGPTGFSNAADYAQVSTDGGDQFHLLGTPPRGQQAAGGGGDCATALSPAPDPGTGLYKYAYAGLGGLNSFATATSNDEGHTLQTGNDPIPGVDRQWLTFASQNDVFLNFNRQQPHDTVVQHSTDGGLTYTDFLNPAVGAPDPEFPGPIKSDLNFAHNVDPTTGNPRGKPMIYFPWTSGDNVYLSVSVDGGGTWNDCLAAVAPGSTRAGFATLDSDTDGNIYIAYASQAGYHSYMTSLPVAKIQDCNNPVVSQGAKPKNNPGFAPPVQVDRNNVRTTVFPWIAAGGAPGRVAVAFYGTESDGDPNTNDFKGSWDVYVNQSLNAMAPDATFSQVKATTHPFHYDSICLNGLACDTTNPGDRSLADFFAISYNPISKKLSVVFDTGAKMPDEPSGHVATPMVINQIAGPSNGGGPDLALDVTRVPLRTATTDPTGDALADYSSVTSTPTPKSEPAADFTNVSVGPELDTNGAVVPNGGFSVTLTVANLSQASIQQELTDTGAATTTPGSALWIFRFANGYQPGAAVASTSDGTTFTFGYNDYTTAGAQCGGGSTSDKCQQYPGDQPIVGKVDQAAGTIVMNVPRSMLRYLTGTTGAGQRPVQLPAVTGVRFEDATAFSLVNTNSTNQSTQSFLYPLDNSPAFDFLLPKADGSAFAVPSAPTGVNAVAGVGEATVSWTPSASDGGSPITGYVVTASPGGQTAQIGALAHTAVVKGLISGTTYTFTVHAVNGVGNSPESAPSNTVSIAGFQQTGPAIDAASPGCLGTGYWTVASDGGVFSFGEAPFFGSTGAMKLNQPVVGMARTPSCGGYWMVATDGGIFSFGNAKFLGSTGNITLNQPIVGMAPTPSGNGYWMVASDGGIFSFGDAAFFGSMGGSHLNAPIVGMAATPTGKGYWMVASDGGIFSFGDAKFFGSTGGITLNSPVVGMARTPSGDGYWFVASDGGIFAFGGAPFLGSEGGAPLNKPVVGMSSSSTGLGYWLVATDGGIFAHGNSQFFGSTGSITLNRPMVGIAPH